ncbi:MAG: urease accessory protein UreE [Gammaproteobacteria bacterium]
MLKLTEVLTNGDVDDTLTLPFEVRQKSRAIVRTDGGMNVGLLLPRGLILRSGMILSGSNGFKVRIQAAPEPVSVALSHAPLLFSRACYHLGNRHVSLQILAGELRYPTDHVLDHMLEGIGLRVTHEDLPFEPEAGAYHAHDH